MFARMEEYHKSGLEEDSRTIIFLAYIEKYFGNTGFADYELYSIFSDEIRHFMMRSDYTINDRYAYRCTLVSMNKDCHTCDFIFRLKNCIELVYNGDLQNQPMWFTYGLFRSGIVSPDRNMEIFEILHAKEWFNPYDLQKSIHYTDTITLENSVTIVSNRFFFLLRVFHFPRIFKNIVSNLCMSIQ